VTGAIWDLVVGHDEAVTMLKEAVAGGRVTHAWLFTGPPGIGKLYTARVFAAALNCPAGGDGTCETCRRILRGVHPDVHLVVPEGDNLLVEDVRAVREEASRTHHESPTAVFILDEADRMTEAAANALLKVLEEPPPEVVFVLVARSVEALVGTVPSRARTLPFVSLSVAELTAALSSDLGLDPEQTAWAAAAGHGRLARARSLLTDEPTRTRRSTVLDLAERLVTGQPSDALSAAAMVGALADEVVAAARVRQERELAELDEAFGTGRGTGALRKRLEVRHRRELRRARFDAIREALADLLGAYRDLAFLTHHGSNLEGHGAASSGSAAARPRAASSGSAAARPRAASSGSAAAVSGGPGAGSPGPNAVSPGGHGAGGTDGDVLEGAANLAGAVSLVHPDRAATFARLAAGIDPATAIRAAGALEEADRRLSIGAAPLLTLEAAFLSVQAALRGPAIPINRLAIRR
jgi:DNA polymerase-3 subunit delta'